MIDEWTDRSKRRTHSIRLVEQQETNQAMRAARTATAAAAPSCFSFSLLSGRKYLHSCVNDEVLQILSDFSILQVERTTPNRPTNEQMNGLHSASTRTSALVLHSSTPHSGGWLVNYGSAVSRK